MCRHKNNNNKEKGKINCWLAQPTSAVTHHPQFSKFNLQKSLSTPIQNKASKKDKEKKKKKKGKKASKFRILDYPIPSFHLPLNEFFNIFTPWLIIKRYVHRDVAVLFHLSLINTFLIMNDFREVASN